MLSYKINILSYKINITITAIFIRVSGVAYNMKETETIKWKGKVRLEGSWGATEWEEVNMVLNVNMDAERTYGWFETYEEGGEGQYYAEGGLWITDNELVDYDGVGSLDLRVLDILENWDFDVEDMRRVLS
tara:strand:- start:68 stop:460 length:393 start_codon:yes stop_codon:yes gene_type:complete